MAKKRFDLELALKGIDEGGLGLVDKAAAKLKLFKKESALSGERALEQTLKTPEGFVSGFGELLGIGKLGVAAIIMDKLAESVKKVSDAMHDVRTGRKSVGEVLTEDLPRAVPIVGTLYGALRDLRSELDGTASAELRVSKALDTATEKMKQHVEAITKIREEERAFAKEMKNLRFETSLGDLTSSFDQAGARAKKKRDDELEDIQKRENFARTHVTGGVLKDELAQIKKDRAEAESAYQDEEAAIGRSRLRAQDDVFDDLQEQLTQQQAERREQNLRDQGKDLDAELDQIQEAGRRKKAALEKQMRDLDRAGLLSSAVKSRLLYQQWEAGYSTDEQVTAARQREAKKEQEEWMRQQEELEARRDELQKQVDGRRQGFQATLLSSRYRGLAEQNRAKVEEANSAAMLSELKELNRRLGPKEFGTEKRMGLSLGYKS